jgi:hypothetical protein
MTTTTADGPSAEPLAGARLPLAGIRVLDIDWSVLMPRRT